MSVRCWSDGRGTQAGKIPEVLEIVKDIRNAKKVTHNNYYWFFSESQAGALFDLHGRQKFFFVKDCKILLFY